ncbi:MAG: hypothetical protein IKN24_07650 [Lachnospiraceae bacterium]|nr:hypothetical protein [Lachnospiraceae bacterium]
MTDVKKGGRRKKDPARKLICVYLIPAVWIAFALINALLPARAYSDRERRSLAQFPSAENGAVLDGRFEEGFEEYAKDQVVGRDALMSAYCAVKSATFNRENGGVYRCADGYLMDMPKVPGEGLPSAYSALLRACDIWQDITLLAVPAAADVCSDLLPGYAREGTRERLEAFSELTDKLPSSVNVCDVRDALLKAYEGGTQVYYRTDHHWTSAGAYEAYKELMKLWGMEAKEYKLLPVCGGFGGTLAAKYGAALKTDTIDIPVPDRMPMILVRISGQTGYTTTIYDMDAVDGPDPYTVFMGGNYGEVTIKTSHKGAGKLLVFKDSYFNALLPYLLDDFEEITFIDPRFYDGDATLLASQYRDRKVLVCYSRNTFLEDNSFTLVIEQ